jgi:hypothetical protein
VLAHTIAAAAGAKDLTPEDFMLGPRMPAREEPDPLAELGLDDNVVSALERAFGKPPPRPVKSTK